MSDLKPDLTEPVVGGIISGIIVGISTALAWVAGGKRRLHERITAEVKLINDRFDNMDQETKEQLDKAEDERKDIWKVTSEHEAQIRVLTQAQLHYQKGIDEVKEMIQRHRA